MGYYVSGGGNECRILAEYKNEAYRLMCELNKHDDLKSGGGRTAKWFSWMSADYPSDCKNAAEILEMLGFEVSEADNGDLSLDAFESKSGDEDKFLDAIGHLMRGEFFWQGEDGERWKHEFGPDGMKVLEGTPNGTMQKAGHASNDGGT